VKLGLRALCLSAILLGSSAAGATASRFAIGCTGKAVFTDNVSGKPSERKYALPKQIYVFDEAAKTVSAALIPRQQFDTVCFRGGYIDITEFSPGLISVTSEAKGRRCDFTVDRKTGKAEYFSHDDLPNGRYTEMTWTMACTKAEIPVFDTSGNRF
jgi:hypothetical protein